MPELERYMLHLLAELDSKLRQAVEDFDYNSYTRLIAEFANNDLSAFYFDIRKDCLYCEVNPATGIQTDKRRAYRTVVDRTVGSTLSRADLAAATLIAAGDPATIGHAVGVGY